MKKIHFVLLALVSVILLDSCASKLPISIKNKTALFRYRTAPDALSSDIDVSSGSMNPLISIAEGVGSAVAGWKADEKLRNAVDENELASALSEGLEKKSQLYNSIKMVESLENNPDLIFETEVLQYSLVANEGVAGLQVRCNIRLIERATSKEVWDSKESRFIAFSETGYSETSIGSTVSSVLNLQKVLSMPDEELAELLYTAAFEAGEYFGEELREASAEE